jgi:hypothetical protein
MRATMMSNSDRTLTLLGATDRAGAILANFCAALGKEQTLACYGWMSPPREARWGETFYEFVDSVGGVAWSSLSEYPKEPGYYELALGVWPYQQGLGWRRQVLDLTVRAAFGTLGAHLVSMLVLDTCRVHHAICLDEWSRGVSPWVLAGRVWHPVKYSIFSYARPAEYRSSG